MQQGKRIALSELWDEVRKQFVTGEDDMADTIKAARRKLEHTDYMKEQPNRNRRESQNQGKIFWTSGLRISQRADITSTDEKSKK